MSFRCWFCKEVSKPGKSLTLVVTQTRKLVRQDREITETVEEKPWCGCEEGAQVAKGAAA